MSTTDKKQNSSDQKPSVLLKLRTAERRLMLLIGDLLATEISLFGALYIWARQDAWLEFSLQFLRERPPFWYYLLPLLWMILMVELYDIQRANKRSDTIIGILIAAGSCFGLYLFVYFTSEPNSLPRQSVAVFIIASALMTMLWRFTYIKIFTGAQFLRRVMIVGAGRTGSELVRQFNQINPPPFVLVGLIDDNPCLEGCEIEGYPVMGSCEDMLSIIEREKVTDLIFAISGEMQPEMFQALLTAEERGIEITTLPIIYEEIMGRVPISLLRSDWILRVFVDQIHAGQFFESAKRAIDIIVGIIGTIILFFLFPLIALAIFLDSGLPIIYPQDRLGKNGKVFTIIKFRTMVKDTEKEEIAKPTVENDKRITRVGHLLRKSHLDEFPQFINILRGDMSFVGPRAEQIELVNEFQQKVPFYRARLLVKPGLTGWAQVNYGYASTVEETKIKLEYDLYYIKHRNLVLDFIIILRTFGTVLGLKGL